jgi:hypothetical protein
MGAPEVFGGVRCVRVSDLPATRIPRGPLGICELDAFGLEVGADLPGDLLAPHQDRVGERPTPIFGDENQVNMKVVDHMATGSDRLIWCPSG